MASGSPSRTRHEQLLVKSTSKQLLVDPAGKQRNVETTRRRELQARWPRQKTYARLRRANATTTDFTRATRVPTIIVAPLTPPTQVHPPPQLPPPPPKPTRQQKQTNSTTTTTTPAATTSGLGDQLTTITTPKNNKSTKPPKPKHTINKATPLTQTLDNTLVNTTRAAKVS